MLTRTHREPRYDAGPNLTPLVDVVLVVLIFLMLGGAMAAPHVLPTKLPPVGAPSAGSFPPPVSIDLRVLDDPANGSFVVAGPGFQVPGNAPQLRDVLAAKLRTFVASGVAASQVRVVIRPSGNVAYQHVLSVYESARQAQFTNVVFGATH